MISGFYFHSSKGEEMCSLLTIYFLKKCVIVNAHAVGYKFLDFIKSLSDTSLYCYGRWHRARCTGRQLEWIGRCSFCCCWGKNQGISFHQVLFTASFAQWHSALSQRIIPVLIGGFFPRIFWPTKQNVIHSYAYWNDQIISMLEKLS